MDTDFTQAFNASDKKALQRRLNDFMDYTDPQI